MPCLPPPLPPPPPVQTNTVSAESTDVKSKTESSVPPPSDDFTRVRSPTRTAKKEAREIDPSKYHTRFIALKFAYLGQRYNGYEHANGNVTPLPTIEEELWKALRKARLIFPTTPSSSTDDFDDSEPRGNRPFTINWEGCDYSKCGRTDRGVSAFGQVIGIRVRSARPKRSPTSKNSSSKQERLTQQSTSDATAVNSQQNITVKDDSSALTSSGVEDNHDSNPEDDWDDIADELPYVQILNNLLPEDIRVLAWCPHPPPGFDARFSCRERRYKYFFTQPAFSPTPGPLGFVKGAAKDRNFREGWLDIEAMREAMKHFVGVHDFRNFCKVDTSKQITNFERIIYHADIELVDPKTHPLGYVGEAGFRALENGTDSDKPAGSEGHLPSTPLVYAFDIRGSAFLWHQVRHMVSILFLIGQGLESPSIIPELLDVSKNPRKPTYEMASDAPLVLWDCIFPDEKSGSREDALEWVYAGDLRMSKSSKSKSSSKGDGKYGLGGVVDGLWSVWRQRKMDEILAGALLDLTVSQGDRSVVTRDPPTKLPRSQKVFYGGNEAKLGGKYVPVMEKKKLDPVEVLNARYLASKERRAEKSVDDGNEEM
ncbi:Pseudouridylate synthase 3 [Rasamsonia emersonii CBS 393.64]|uniref:Pseudouridylate synthase 3 n=1 Tax=Rasamsonia emersonii (strain ATCC 16479 / CBS 393.64 / IMI 116815) TaxID=1408163 RepID=A0A0F4YZ75_RASE3|nr:Pseudouridylate synthase 3 [Rasamsonia emersonii CBS 393.64]KKA23597.1 Pseudouridylate synthase 3 [Rasamsonia emersonii CBS 393.64]